MKLASTQVFVLADTSYNSSGVDEVAAEHADADCVVQFVPGRCGQLWLLSGCV